MDIELFNPDNTLIDSGTSPYDHEYGNNYTLVKSLGFNWSDLGVVTPPSNIATFVGYINSTSSGENITDSVYVGIAFPSNIVMSVSNTAGRWVGNAYNSLQHKYNITSTEDNYAIIRLGQDTGSQPWTVLLLADYSGSGLYTPHGLTWRAGWNNPFVNADIVITDTTIARITSRVPDAVHDYFYAGSDTVCDAYVFSDAIDATEENATFKFKNWGNLQNMPVGKLPSDYTVGVKYSTHLNPDSGLVAAFTSKSGVIEKSYLELFETLTPTEQTTASTNGYMDFKFVLRHGLTVATEDSFHIVRLYPNGNMTLISEASPGHLYVKPFISPYDNDLYDDDDGILIQQVPGQQMSVDNLLTTSYAMTDNELQQFGSFLWSNNEPATNYKEMQTAPIENVLSCKRIPFDVPNVGENPQKVEVHCGNVRTGVMAYKALTTHKHDVGVITIPAYTNDYMDYENNISIYLPYCGIQMIPTGLCYKRTLVNAKDADGNNITAKNSNGTTYTVQVPKVVGRKLGVVYYYDIVYGSCCALLYIDATWDSTNNEVTGGNLIAAFNGDCGVDIPITASNRAANELSLRKAGDSMIAGAVMGAAGGFVTGGAVGGLLGGALGLAGGFANKAVQQRNQDTHYTTSGGFSSQIASYMSKTVTLFVEHTTYKKDPQAYAHENGYPCNLTLNMKALKGLGYTELSGEIEISGIDCLEEERDGLKQALMDGFYISDNTALAPQIGVVD